MFFLVVFVITCYMLICRSTNKDIDNACHMSMCCDVFCVIHWHCTVFIVIFISLFVRVDVSIVVAQVFFG